MSPTGIDQSWGYADPAAAARAGVQVVSMYLSNDPSKNATAAKIKAYHAHGIGVLLNWENDAGAPLQGAGKGHADSTAAVALLRALIAAVGYRPGSKLAVPFSCDRDVNPGQYGPIDAYYGATRSIVHAAGLLNGCYGEFDLVEHLHAKGLTDMEWQTLAWSGGRISPQADFYQSSINNTLGGASVDFDQVRNAEQVGAWWPPGHRLDQPAPLDTRTATPIALEDDVYIVSVSKSDCAKAKVPWPGVFLTNGLAVSHIVTMNQLAFWRELGVKTAKREMPLPLYHHLGGK